MTTQEEFSLIPPFNGPLSTPDGVADTGTDYVLEDGFMVPYDEDADDIAAARAALAEGPMIPYDEVARRLGLL